MRFAFIQAHCDIWPLSILCRVLDVSRSGYYAWLNRAPSARAVANAELLERIIAVHEENRGLYGSPRVHAQLQREGTHCSLGRVERLMRAARIRGRRPRRFVLTTHPGGAYETTENLLARRFAVSGVNALVADITAIPTQQGFLYLAAVLSLRSRSVLGYAMGAALHGALGLEALRMAMQRGSIVQGTLHHSDRGSHYVSHAFRGFLDRHGLIQSMSRKGDCYDNAVAESFFATLKSELSGPGKPATRRQAQAMVVEYIDGYYNSRRLHSSLGYRTPEEYAKLLTASI